MPKARNGWTNISTCVRSKMWRSCWCWQKSLVMNWMFYGNSEGTQWHSLYVSGVAFSNCLVFWRLKRLFEMSGWEEEADEASYPIFMLIFVIKWNFQFFEGGKKSEDFNEAKTLNPTRLIAVSINSEERRNRHVRIKERFDNLSKNRTHKKCKLSTAIVHWKCKWARHEILLLLFEKSFNRHVIWCNRKRIKRKTFTIIISCGSANCSRLFRLDCFIFWRWQFEWLISYPSLRGLLCLLQRLNILNA